MSRHGASLPFAALALLLLVTSCSASAKEIREARQSGYMADFAVVYGAALAATKELYPSLREDATRGLIQTAWHPLRVAAQTAGETQNPDQTNALGTSSRTAKHFFIRFRVFVLGGKPFQIRIEGEASSWQQGEVPSPMRGAEIPPWLGGRTDALRVAIHKRLKEHAVPLEVAKKVEKKPAVVPRKSEKSFGPIPKAAAKVIATVAQAAEGRDLETLRQHLDEDIEWAAGGSKGADSAIAIWSADPLRLTELSKAVNAGCAEKGALVVCPTVALGDNYRGYAVYFALVDGVWKIKSFFER